VMHSYFRVSDQETSIHFFEEPMEYFKNKNKIVEKKKKKSDFFFFFFDFKIEKTYDL